MLQFQHYNFKFLYLAKFSRKFKQKISQKCKKFFEKNCKYLLSYNFPSNIETFDMSAVRPPIHGATNIYMPSSSRHISSRFSKIFIGTCTPQERCVVPISVQGTWLLALPYRPKSLGLCFPKNGQKIKSHVAHRGFPIYSIHLHHFRFLPWRSPHFSDFLIQFHHLTTVCSSSPHPEPP